MNSNGFIRPNRTAPFAISPKKPGSSGENTIISLSNREKPGIKPMLQDMS
ncbi:MAG: hypothetical protein AAFY21_14465 [Cyanobacteria bacterium J06641_2]